MKNIIKCFLALIISIIVLTLTGCNNKIHIDDNFNLSSTKTGFGYTNHITGLVWNDSMDTLYDVTLTFVLKDENGNTYEYPYYIPSLFVCEDVDITFNSSAQYTKIKKVTTNLSGQRTLKSNSIINGGLLAIPIFVFVIFFTFAIIIAIMGIKKAKKLSSNMNNTVDSIKIKIINTKKQTVICEYCETENNEDDKICSQCGAPLKKKE